MTHNELTSEQELSAAIEELIKDERTIKAFDLPPEMMKELFKVKLGGKGFSISPNFKSIGWGENDTDALMIELSDIGNDKAVLKHELRHALHCLTCAYLFNKNNGLTSERVQNFVSDILEDPGFYEWRKRLNGDESEDEWREVVELAHSGNLDEIDRNSLKFGSILYQHAYYLDPLMCEAAASINDTGLSKINGAVNRFVAKHIIPYEQVLEGYGWKEAQEAFDKASFENKTMFMSKKNYSRVKCFGLK